MTTRKALRAFQAARTMAASDPGLFADLEMLRHRDLDLSIKAGALLGFNGLILGAGINPLSASPGAPLSLDAVSSPIAVCLTALGVLLVATAAFYCVRCIMVGEDFDDSGIESDPKGVLLRLMAAYCVAVDKEAALLAKAVLWTYAGGAVMVIAFFGSLITKWL